MMKMRPHENVILLKGFCKDPLCIVTQFIEGGDLQNYLTKKGETADYAQLFSFCKGISRGLLHLHEEGVVHRDLAARNILLSESIYGYEAIITDFGMSRNVINFEDPTYVSSKTIGPIKWMAPESLKFKVSSPKSDIWSFGCVIIEIFDCGRLYEGFTDKMQIAMDVRQGNLKPPMNKNRIPESIIEILEQCFEYEPEKRITTLQITQKLQTIKQ